VFLFAVYSSAIGAAFALSWALAHRRGLWARMGLALGGAIIIGVLLWFDCSPRAFVMPALAGALGVLPRSDDSTSTLRAKLDRSMVWVYLAALATVALTVWVYLPVLAFLTSPGELAVHIDFLLANNLRASMAMLYGGLLLYAICASPRLRAALTVLAVAGMVIALTYSFILPFGYPRLSGLSFEHIELATKTVMFRLAIDVVAVLVLPVLSIALLARVGGRRFLAGLLFVNLSLGVVTVITIRRDLNDQAGDGTEVAAAPLRYSRDGHNALLIFLDRFMGGYVEKILAEDPALAADLDGFTWVPNTVAAGYNSIAGLPPLLGGYDYTPREMNARRRSLRELTNEAFSILPWNFTRHGWEASLLRPNGLNFTLQGDCSVLTIPGLRCGQIPLQVAERAARAHGISMEALSKSNYVDLLVLLSSMRVAPYTMKATLLGRGPWEPFLRHTAGNTLREWAELEALPHLSSTAATKNQLNIVFNFLPHEPYYIGEDCTPLSEKVQPAAARLAQGNWPDAFAYHHEMGARCALRLVRDYLVWLREQGVYDNTTIVIASDHGILGSVKDRSSRAVAGGTEGNEYVASRSLLLYKPRDAHGPVITSDAFLPNAEVPRLLCQDIGGCINPFLGGKTIEAHGRDDPFYVAVVPWQFNAQKLDRFVIEREFVLTGKDPYRRGNWRVAR
jgi:hypothetical protein